MSPALRVALSIAVMRAPCSPAALSSKGTIELDRQRLRQQLRQDRLFIRLEVVLRTAGVRGLALGRRGRGDDLLFGDDLADHRLEPVIDQRRRIDLTGREHLRHAGADLLRVGEFDPLLAGIGDVADDPAGKLPPQIVAPFAADGEDLHRLAFGFQLARQVAGGASDLRVERTRQAAIRGDRDQQCDLVGPGAHQQLRRRRADPATDAASARSIRSIRSA